VYERRDRALRGEQVAEVLDLVRQVVAHFRRDRQRHESAT